MTFPRSAPALAALALFVVQPPVLAQVPEGPGLVTVRGTGVVRRAPDVAYVVFVAESRNERPGVAQRDAAAAMTAVHDRLQAAGIGDDALRTLSYDLSPEYEFVDNRRRLDGYVARNRLEARVDEVGRVGEMVDAGVAAGATSIEGLRFDVKDRAAAEREALRAAAADAWARAETAAAGVGRVLDRVVRIEEPGLETPVGRPEMMSMRATAAPAEPAPPIVSGAVEIRARVTLTASLR